MSKLSGLRTRLRRAFQRRAMDQQLLDEMKDHLEQETARRIALGEEPTTARRLAAAEFGSVDARTEEVRERRWGTTIELWWHDFAQAARSLRRDPRFSFVVIITLAVGIGASTAIYSVIDRVLLNPVPGPNADRIVQVGEWSNHSVNPEPTALGVSPPVLQALIEERAAFAGFTWSDIHQMLDLEDGFVTSAFGARVAPGFFEFFEASPLLGRSFREDEALDYDSGREPPTESAVMLSHGWWQRRFEGDPSIVGQTVRVGDRSLTVVGVMPPHFQYPRRNTQFWLPSLPDRPHPRIMKMNSAVALLKLPPEGGLARVQGMLDTLAKRVQADESTNRSYLSIWQKSGQGLQLWARPLSESLGGILYGLGFATLRDTLGGLALAIALVLAMVCANTAHLTLARTERRRRDLAVRAALGARRSRLTRQLLLESALLALISGAFALVLTHWGLRLLGSLNQLPQLRPLAVDIRTLGIAFAVTAATVICFGLWPAWRGSRVPVNTHLKNSANTATLDVGARRQGRGLASLEVALALMLLSGAGLMIRSVIAQLSEHPGFSPENLLSVQVSFTPTGGFDPKAGDLTRARVTAAMDRLAALPGVEAIGNYKATGALPVASPSGDVIAYALRNYVSVGERNLFAVVGAPLLAGRFLSAADHGEDSAAVLINQTMARKCWPDRDPIGQIFGFTNGPKRTYEVVGVVADLHFLGIEESINPEFYRPLPEAPAWGMPERILLRTAQDPALLANAARQALREMDDNIRLPQIETMTSALFDSTQARRTYRNYLCIFAATALLLAALGIHSVLAYSVALRTREIGIRMALGADPRQIVRLILVEGGRIAIAGIALGLLGTITLGKLIRHQLYGISSNDPWVLGGVTVLLATVALAACLLPAARAAKADPIQALRSE